MRLGCGWVRGRERRHSVAREGTVCPEAPVCLETVGSLERFRTEEPRDLIDKRALHAAPAST